MKIKLPARLLMAALLATGANCAQAMHYVKLSGANVDFYYDADVWGAGSATVAGDAISFAPANRFAASVTTGADESEYIPRYYGGAGSVVAVAQQGRALTGDIEFGLTGSYSLPQEGGVVTLAGALHSYDGSFNNWKYLQGSTALETSDFGFQAFSNMAAPQTAVPVDPQPASFNAAPSGYRVVGVDTDIFWGVEQSGSGTTSAEISRLSFGFETVSAVPEPETYAMMLAGLALIGVVGRRRKGA